MCSLVLSGVLVAVGCAAPQDEPGHAAPGATSGPASLDLALTIAESKMFFTSKVEAFAVRDRQAMTLLVGTGRSS
jgi:hypothetical protein